MRWAFALVLACACGRVNFDPLVEARDGDMRDATETDACSMWSAWSTPALLPSVNSDGIDWAPSISDDRLFMTLSSNRTGNSELFTTQRQSLADDWDPPVIIGELAGGSDEEDDPTLSADLREMFFGNTIIFRTTRADLVSPWGQPAVVVPDDFDFVQGAELSSDDLRLYFSAGSPVEDLYVMERPIAGDPFGPYMAIMPDLDPSGDTGHPTFSADELEIFLSSDHGGERDIYTSRRASRTSAFPQVTRVAELSAQGSSEWDPELSLDGTTMWLSSDRPGGMGLDLFVATRTCED